MQLGVTSSFTDVSSYFEAPPLHISYLYSSSEHHNYLFPDTKMDDVSFLPPLEITGKKVIFTFNRQLALYYDNAFIYSTSNFLKKIKLPRELNQDLLDKIGTVANYLCGGQDYEYQPGTAKFIGRGIVFLVKKGETLWRATLSSLKENRIFYHVLS